MTANSSLLSRIDCLQRKLIELSRHWAYGSGFDAEQARLLRTEAVLLNHEYYLENIPVYRKLALEEQVEKISGISEIQNKLMLTDGIYKGYNQSWIDDGDFSAMSNWLSSVSNRPVRPPGSRVKILDEWLDDLGRQRVDVTFSSGTSGAFSFVPRDKADRDMARTANICSLSPLLVRRGIGLHEDKGTLEKVARKLSPEVFARTVAGVGLPDFDAFFLGFRSGKLGNQSLMSQLAPVFRRHSYLFNFELPAAALRIINRGPRTESEYRIAVEFQSRVSGKLEEHFLRLIGNMEAATRAGQKVFLFGTPVQFLQLLEAASAHRFSLNPGSVALFGGGWKGFNGRIMKRDDLVAGLAAALNLPVKNILEGYSMTEISVLTLRCECGHFHIPPVLEPIIFDDELRPLEGERQAGIFGFLDPLALSHPGFIISGDYVHLANKTCACGLSGPALTEISRAPGEKVKGCGGTMSSLQA